MKILVGVPITPKQPFDLGIVRILAYLALIQI